MTVAVVPGRRGPLEGLGDTCCSSLPFPDLDPTPRQVDENVAASRASAPVKWRAAADQRDPAEGYREGVRESAVGNMLSPAAWRCWHHSPARGNPDRSSARARAPNDTERGAGQPGGPDNRKYGGARVERNSSLWQATAPSTSYPSLAPDLSVDVVVVGGGITGLTTAYLLSQAGASVAVLEGRRIATGTTGHTTAKITSLHGLPYAQLMNAQGEDRTRRYAEANQAAIEEIARIIERERIECDFRRAAAYTWTESRDRVAEVEGEAEAALRLGLPAAFVQETPLPFPIQGAVRFSDQAMFHPRKYCLGLAAAVVNRGGQIFEESRADRIEERDGRVFVSTGDRAIEADRVVQATLLPFHDPGGAFAKTHPSRSYAIAARVADGGVDGMFLGIDEPTRSVRPHTSGGETYLVIGGEEHKTGQDDETEARYQAIEAWARERFGVTSIDHRWSAQDYMPADGIPYVGRAAPGNDRILVATGFKKWGMSNGTAAAMMLKDRVLDRPNEWLETFDATRLRPRQSLGELVGQNVDVARRFVGDRVSLAPSLADLPPGQGAVVQENGRRLAAYRDEAGALSVLSARCTHMGCLVAFNEAERSWDCPCHGSRFDLSGAVLEGPATAPLSTERITDLGSTGELE